MKVGFVWLLAALVLSGCGAVGGGAAPPTSTPSDSPAASPGAGFDVTVTESIHSVTLRAGQTLAVVLHAKPGMTNWNGVQSSDHSVLAPIVNPAASAARGVTLAAFKAIAPGKARIDASAGPLCSPGQACPQYLMVLTIAVTVTGA
jgi:hypothetical protein